VLGGELGHAALRVDVLLGLDGDVGRLATQAASGWCIMMRALGSVKRMPASPTVGVHRRTATGSVTVW